jgi:hypothetical protein
VILGRLLRGLGVGAIAVLMMSSGMAGWLIVLEQFRVIAIQVDLFRAQEPYMWGVLAEYGHIWGQEDLFLNCSLNFRFFEEQFDGGRTEG